MHEQEDDCKSALKCLPQFLNESKIYQTFSYDFIVNNHKCSENPQISTQRKTGPLASSIT